MASPNADRLRSSCCSANAARTVLESKTQSEWKECRQRNMIDNAEPIIAIELSATSSVPSSVAATGLLGSVSNLLHFWHRKEANQRETSSQYVSTVTNHDRSTTFYQRYLPSTNKILDQREVRRDASECASNLKMKVLKYLDDGSFQVGDFQSVRNPAYQSNRVNLRADIIQ
ncbi:hypothetical protein PGTUg99_021334 [Puccinia graminis f. sp. tritici]|uniref:Uncharacterized protein n=1 Tax=Puccinia graminis f. sp. tritici TaxID=56615 RepID=A0A5B0NWY6_PUCGR|nr:hypothetical protein PGTUg99_021334 [Puccinia graminis f. sp. tritici]